MRLIPYAVAITLNVCILTTAEAAPPSSCASKFVGTWTYPGGTTVIAPNGLAYPKCPMCVPTQTWTCQGNTYLFSNSGPPGQFTATLSADGRQLTGGGTIATKVGGVAARPAAEMAPQSNSPAVDRTNNSDDPSPGDVDAKQCINVLPGKSSGTWRVHNKCPYGVTVGYSAGSVRARDFIGPKGYDPVISNTEPQITSACARGSRNCK